jgi:hypothetical protein
VAGYPRLLFETGSVFIGQDRKFHPPGSRPGAYASYFLGYAAATFYFSTLFYRESEGQLIAIPVICALLALWRQILLRKP